VNQEREEEEAEDMRMDGPTGNRATIRRGEQAELGVP